ncbi:MAG: hypothetical protein J6D11_04460 [Clostridia bacterium]|nr:hypothetical protein [Clostridia bacterium]
MYGLIHVCDHNIIAINQGLGENESKEIIYKDKKNQRHIIDLDVCCTNFKNQYGTANGNCVGDRNITQGYFLFSTSGIETKISFKRTYVFNLFGNKILFGNKAQRFMQFEKIISKLGYTTYDLS